MPTDLSTIDLPNADDGTLRQALLDLICEVAYKEGDFTLSSGKKSDYYITVSKLRSSRWVDSLWLAYC